MERQAEKHQNRQENKRHAPKLTPEMEAAQWKPGQSGNPGGRPKRKPLTDAYAAVLQELVPGDREGRTFAQVIAMAMAQEAVKGKINAAAELADRVEGKTIQQLALAGPDGGPIPLANVTASDLTDDQLAALIAGGK